jgi:hypothetical protein
MVTHVLDSGNAQRIDDTDPDTIYIGYAKTGSANSDAVWSIKRMQVVSGVKEVRWSNGKEYVYTSIWDNRTSTVSYI